MRIQGAVALAAMLLLAGCEAGTRTAEPHERSFEIAVGEVVIIPVVGTNHSARTGPQISGVTGESVSHELKVGSCKVEQPGCTSRTTMVVKGVKAGTTTIDVRGCFFGNGPEDCQQNSEPETYTIVVK